MGRRRDWPAGGPHIAALTVALKSSIDNPFNKPDEFGKIVWPLFCQVDGLANGIGMAELMVYFNSMGMAIAA